MLPLGNYRPALAASLLFLTACGSGGSATSRADDPADLVVYGRVWTGDSARPWASAVAIRGDRIAAVGDSAEIARLVGPATRTLSSGAGLVTPGFMDSHTHFIDGGIQLASIDLRPATSPEDFIRRVKAFVSERKPGEWILGGEWDHERWPGAPLPTRQWIDSVTPDNPVFVFRLDGHMALANTAALRKAGIGRSMRDIPGGVVVRDKSGAPTGVLKDGAMVPVEQVIPDPTPAQRDAALGRAMRYAAERGVTAVCHVSVPWLDLGTYRRARDDGRLITRIALYFPLATWHQVADTIARGGRGDDVLWIGGVKGYMDGSLGSGTALFYQPYADDPKTVGVLRTPEDSLRAWIGAADSAGLQVAVHAIGERANGLLLDIYDSLARAHGPRDRRFRVEHAQHLRPVDVPRFGRGGIIASMQPAHLIDDANWAGKRLGPDRIKHSYVFRSLLASGAPLAFGSDWSVAPMDPILGIYAAVTRRSADGKNPGGWIPEQKISVEEALRAYTAGGAYGVFAEGRRGRVIPGYLADLVLLDRDLTRIPPEEIAQVKVTTTIMGGKVVFSAH
ncbi:MAG TPA: amidohydrolase [Gemmatimonadales bacterium]|nr:amidohydrolase [Gemmatimonadales bacterium]